MTSKMTRRSIKECIAAKRFGEKLSDDDIASFVQKCINKEAHDAQIGAMLMAIAINGLDSKETECLTREMIYSGRVFNWPGVVVDKHSTGGVGDKISIPLAPALAALGLKVPMLSGRALDHTGGTLDKLESIPGYTVGLTFEEMQRAILTSGLFMAETTPDICPADRIIYPLRDATSTVSVEPLIIGSIVSKKIAGGGKYFTFDMKVGSSALFKTVDVARPFAQKLIDMCGKFGMKARAFLTRMESPLGRNVGNALEIKESIDVLKGNGPSDVVELVCRFGGELLFMSGEVKTVEEGVKEIGRALTNGSALEKFKQMLAHHKVTDSHIQALCSNPWSVMTEAKHKTLIPSPASGWIKHIDGMTVAIVAQEIGGGRTRPNEKIKHEVGIELLNTVGDQVEKGKNVMIVHHSSPVSEDNLLKLHKAITISPDPVVVESLIIEVLEQSV